MYKFREEKKVDGHTVRRTPNGDIEIIAGPNSSASITALLKSSEEKANKAVGEAINQATVSTQTSLPGWNIQSGIVANNGSITFRKIAPINSKTTEASIPCSPKPKN